MYRIVALFLLLFIACSSTSYVTYRPVGSTDAAWKIEAKWKSFSNHLTVKINGNEVVDTGVYFFLERGSAEGTYKDKNVLAEITKSSGPFRDKYLVQILVDGELAAQFNF